MEDKSFLIEGSFYSGINIEHYREYIGQSVFGAVILQIFSSLLKLNQQPQKMTLKLDYYVSALLLGLLRNKNIPAQCSLNP